jgi:hypothetical protein
VDVDFFDPARARLKPPFDLVAEARRVLGPPVVEGMRRQPTNTYTGQSPDYITSAAAAAAAAPATVSSASMPSSDAPARDGARSTGDSSARRGGITKLLSVFKWEARKAPEVLLRAYLSEFDSSDPVALFVRCNLYHEHKDVVGERIAQMGRDMFTAAAAAAAAAVSGGHNALPWGAPPGMDVEEALRTHAPRVNIKHLTPNPKHQTQNPKPENNLMFNPRT